ncbi:MAG: hypothetical protein PHE49_07150 [bacterium]|nr:hypothetical protein [bacterium]
MKKFNILKMLLGNRIIKKIAVFTLLTLVNTNAIAEPIVGSTPTTMPSLGFMFREHFMYINYTSQRLNDTTYIKIGADSSFTRMVNVLQIDYGFEKNWTLRLTIPVTFENMKLDTTYSKFAPGGITLDTKYNLFNPTKEMGFVGTYYLEFSPFLGVRFPTGDKSAFFSPTKSSTDLELGILGRFGDSKGAAYLTFGYWSNGLLSKDENITDEIFYNFTIESPFIFNKVMILCELDGLASTAGDTYYYSLRCYPGLKYRLLQTVSEGGSLYQKTLHELLLEATCAIPIAEMGDFKYDYAPYVGINWKF